LSDHGRVVEVLNAELKTTKDPFTRRRRKKKRSEGAIFLLSDRVFTIPVMFAKLDRKYSAFKEEV